MHRLRVTSTLALALLCVASSALMRPAGADSASAIADVEAQTFRAALGLRADVAWVAAVADRADHVTKWGSPLTPDESAELDRRFEIQQHQDGLVAVLSNSSEYAGLWVDELNRGELVINWVGTPRQDVLSTAKALLPPGAAFRFRTVDTSLSALDELASKLASYMGTEAGRSLGMLTVDADEVADRVTVGVPANAKVAEASLRSTFGNLVSVELRLPDEPMACQSRTNCGTPMKGDLQIYHPQDPTHTLACTSGFMGRVLNNPQPNDWFLLTSGHCLKDGGNGAAWFHNGVWIGSTVAWSFANGADADIGIIHMNSLQTPMNEVFATAPTDIRDITSWITNANQTVGSLACRGGYKSDNYLCGTITQVNFTATVGGTTIDHMNRMSIASIPGDSGGPIMANFAAMGYESASNGSSSVYSTVDWAILTQPYKPCRAQTFPC